MSRFIDYDEEGIPDTDRLTSIQLHESTIEKLKIIGKMGESYEKVILRLLENFKQD